MAQARWRTAAAMTFTCVCMVLGSGAGAAPGPERGKASAGADSPTPRVVRSDAEWKRLLEPARYEVLRHKATEPAFTGAYWNNHAKGTYRCAGCGLPLFSSATKFDSGTGWPSFTAPIAKANVGEDKDTSFGMVREEVFCARCGGHLGHLFDDGPAPSHLRYCINSAALTFVPSR